MKHLYRCCLLLLAALVLAACELGPRPVHQTVFPTIGPVRQVTGAQDSSLIELTASTNCAEVGEVVTFTASITNRTTYPIVITGTPILDIALTPADSTAPVQRWSESSQYPGTINPILAPGEVRVYQWHWVADAAYAREPGTDQNGVFAKLLIGEIRLHGYSIPANSIENYVGVGTYRLPQPGTGVRCGDMGR